MKRGIMFVLAVLFACNVSAQRKAKNSYWFYFTDKNQNGYTIDHPEEFLSQRSIDRRAWQSLPIDHTDLPVTQKYIDSLSALNAEVLYVSKWLNGVLIQSEDTMLVNSLHKLSFIDTLQWEPETDELYFPEKVSENRFPGPLSDPPNYSYGYSYNHIEQLKLNYLHEKGYTGKGVLLAVLDAGFTSLPEMPAFKTPIANGQILHTKNFVSKGDDIYQGHSHGTSVSSLIIANWPDNMVGVSPDVDLLLAVTENAIFETKIEEYSWIEAAEWADSLGADVLNTSLGYTTFDDSTTNYRYQDMDGKTAHISIANGMTASKGMVSATSAGNSGDEEWHYIGAPADATDILSVGAVNYSGELAPFSSRGPSYDHRIKPEISATGWNVAVQSLDSTVRFGSGTSYSSPIIAGSTAVLWQAYPSMTAKELMRWIINSSNRASSPNVEYGYGVPAFSDAYYAITSIEKKSFSENFKIYPNPFTNFLNIEIPDVSENKFRVIISNIQGKIVYSQDATIPGRINLPDAFHPGMYLLEVKNNQATFRGRIIKY